MASQGYLPIDASSKKRKLLESITMTGSQSSEVVSAKRKQPDFRTSIQTVTIKVGEGKDVKAFTVHKDFLCYYSPYFRTAFEGNFQEGQTKISTIKEHQPATFGYFLNWLYTQKLEDSDGKLPSSKNLIRLWILADMVLVPKLQNLIISALNTSLWEENGICTHMIPYIYDNTVPGSPLRKLLVFQVAWYCNVEQMFKGHEINFPIETLRDLVLCLKEHNALPDRKDLPMFRVEDFFVNTRDAEN